MVDLCHLYFLLNATYILESVVGELGQRPIHKSNYLLFHHLFITSIAWFVANFYPGGHTTFLMFVNSFVNILIDIYYLVVVLLFPVLKSKTEWLKDTILCISVRYNFLRSQTKFNIFLSILSSHKCLSFSFTASNYSFGILVTFQHLFT
jgi:GNS1/SUR4 family